MTKKTKVLEKTLEPVWNERFWFDFGTNGTLHIQCYDKDKMYVFIEI